MKPKFATLRYLLPTASTLFAVSSLHAATFYWDGSSPISTAGFGTAGGTWVEDSTTGFNWTTSNTGSISGNPTQATGNTDVFNFGTATDGVGAGTITVSGTVNMGNTTFGSASGAIVLSGGTIAFSASPTITVNNASNTINSTISNALTGTFTKVGGGILILGGTNAYTGATSITGGTLRAGAAAGGQAFGVNSAVTLSNTAGVTLDLNGFSQTIGSLAGGGATGGNVTLGSSSAVLTLGGNNTSTSFAGVISGTGTSALIKIGTGTQTLTGANTYAGTTTINAGAIDLGGGTASGSLSSATLALAGGSFNYTRTGTNTQTFTNTSISGASMITGAAGNTLNLGTVTRGNNSRFYDFGTTGLGTIAAATASNTAGIMAGFTVGDSWAVANGTGVAISALGSYTLTSVAGTTASNYTANNIDVDDSAGTLGGTITANSLRFSTAAANTLALATGTNTLSSGGILVGSGVGANLSTISGGTLTGPVSKDLAIIQNNTSGGLTISSVIANNTSTSLTKSGSGLLTLSGNNTFTGGLTIHAGTVAVGNAGALNSTAGSQNAVTFGQDSTGILALTGNNVVIANLSTNSIAGTTFVQNANGSSVSNATLTVGNSVNQSGNFAGVIRDGTGGGTLALTKAGTGTLTLSAPNTYTGGTTLSAGTLALSNASSLGTNNVSITGSSRINATGGNGVGLTYANAINVGAALQLQNPQSATGSTATFSGQLTGSSAITIVNGGANAVLAGIAFTNTNNTFTGNVIMPSGSVAGDDRFSFNSIGDGGNFTIQKAGHQNAVIHTGSSNITFNTRQITIGTGFGGGIVDGGGVTPINRFMNNGGGTVTFNSNMGVTTIASAGTFFFDGSNTGNNTFAGTIANPTSGGNLGIGKNGAGKWILTGANGFDGETVIHEGTLSVNSVAALSSTNQPLGNNTVVQLGFRNNTGATLEFTGSSNSTTDKQIRLGNTLAAGTGAGSILNNGTGSLVFTNATFNPTITGITVTRTLTLGGTYSGSGFNEIQGIVQNNAAGGLVSLTVSGSMWKISGTNTYTGGSSISNGATLIFGKTTAKSGTGTHAFAAGSTLGLGVSGVSGFIDTDITNAFAGTMTGNLAGITVTTTTHVGIDTTAGAFTYGASIAGSPTKGLVKLGTNTLNLTGANTYTGGTTINQGTLSLGHANAIGSTGTIRFTGGTLQFTSANTTDYSSRFSTAAGQTFSFDTNSEDVTLASSLTSAAGTFSKIGAGTLTLSGSNSFGSGTLTYGSGTTDRGALRLASADALGNYTAINMPANNAGVSRIELIGGVNFNSYDITTAGRANGITTGAALVSISGNNTWNGDIAITGTGGSYGIRSDADLLTLTGELRNDLPSANGTRTWSLTGDGDILVSGQVKEGNTGPLAISKSGNGTATLTNNSNTYTGATTVSAGTLLVNGNVSTSNATVSGGTLGGTGTIGGTVTINSGGTLSPGASIESLATGALTMDAGSSFAYEAANNGSTGADLLAVNGTVSLTGVTLSLDAATLAALGGGGWSLGDKLTLISYIDGGSGITSGFAGYLDNTAYFFGANAWLFDYNDTAAGGNYGTDAVASGQNRFVTMTVVPEPGAALLGSLGLLALLRRRR